MPNDLYYTLSEAEIVNITKSIQYEPARSLTLTINVDTAKDTQLDKIALALLFSNIPIIEFKFEGTDKSKIEDCKERIYSTLFYEDQRKSVTEEYNSILSSLSVKKKELEELNERQEQYEKEANLTSNAPTKNDSLILRIEKQAQEIKSETNRKTSLEEKKKNLDIIYNICFEQGIDNKGRPYQFDKKTNRIMRLVGLDFLNQKSSQNKRILDWTTKNAGTIVSSKVTCAAEPSIDSTMTPIEEFNNIIDNLTNATENSALNINLKDLTIVQVNEIAIQLEFTKAKSIFFINAKEVSEKNCNKTSDTPPKTISWSSIGTNLVKALKKNRNITALSGLFIIPGKSIKDLNLLLEQNIQAQGVVDENTTKRKNNLSNIINKLDNSSTTELSIDVRDLTSTEIEQLGKSLEKTTVATISFHSLSLMKPKDIKTIFDALVLNNKILSLSGINTLSSKQRDELNNKLNLNQTMAKDKENNEKKASVLVSPDESEPVIKQPSYTMMTFDKNNITNNINKEKIEAILSNHLNNEQDPVGSKMVKLCINAESLTNEQLKIIGQVLGKNITVKSLYFENVDPIAQCKGLLNLCHFIQRDNTTLTEWKAPIDVTKLSETLGSSDESGKTENLSNVITMPKDLIKEIESVNKRINHTLYSSKTPFTSIKHPDFVAEMKNRLDDKLLKSESKPKIKEEDPRINIINKLNDDLNKLNTKIEDNNKIISDLAKILNVKPIGYLKIVTNFAETAPEQLEPDQLEDRPGELTELINKACETVDRQQKEIEQLNISVNDINEIGTLKNKFMIMSWDIDRSNEKINVLKELYKGDLTFKRQINEAERVVSHPVINQLLDEMITKISTADISVLNNNAIPVSVNVLPEVPLVLDKIDQLMTGEEIQRQKKIIEERSLVSEKEKELNSLESVIKLFETQITINELKIKQKEADEKIQVQETKLKMLQKELNTVLNVKPTTEETTPNAPLVNHIEEMTSNENSINLNEELEKVNRLEIGLNEKNDTLNELSKQIKSIEEEILTKTKIAKQNKISIAILKKDWKDKISQITEKNQRISDICIENNLSKEEYNKENILLKNIKNIAAKQDELSVDDENELVKNLKDSIDQANAILKGQEDSIIQINNKISANQTEKKNAETIDQLKTKFQQNNEKIKKNNLEIISLNNELTDTSIPSTSETLSSDTKSSLAGVYIIKEFSEEPLPSTEKIISLQNKIQEQEKNLSVQYKELVELLRQKVTQLEKPLESINNTTSNNQEAIGQPLYSSSSEVLNKNILKNKDLNSNIDQIYNNDTLNNNFNKPIDIIDIIEGSIPPENNNNDINRNNNYVPNDLLNKPIEQPIAAIIGGGPNLKKLTDYKTKNNITSNWEYIYANYREENEQAHIDRYAFEKLPLNKNSIEKLHTSNSVSIEQSKLLQSTDGLPITSPSGLNYVLSVDKNGIPKAVLKEDTLFKNETSAQKQQREAITIINMIDNVLSHSTNVNIKTSNDYLATIANLYLLHLNATLDLKIDVKTPEKINVDAQNNFNRLIATEFLSNNSLMDAAWYKQAVNFRSQMTNVSVTDIKTKVNEMKNNSLQNESLIELSNVKNNIKGP